MSLEDIFDVPVISKLEKERLAKILDKPEVKQKIVNAMAEAQGEAIGIEISDTKIKIARKKEHDVIEVDLDEFDFNDD